MDLIAENRMLGEILRMNELETIGIDKNCQSSCFI